MATPVSGDKIGTLQLSSSAFRDGEKIPPRFTYDGEDVSPPLQWSGAPSATRSFVLLCEDPDAPRGTWLHWLLYNLPSDAIELAEGVPLEAVLPSGARQSDNDSGTVGYEGPCPPRGRSHRYVFRLYALDTQLSLTDDGRSALESAMDHHVLATGTLTGTYQRQH